MARHLSTENEINDYIEKIKNEADHHGRNVADIVLPLAHTVLQALDLQRDRVEVYERNGRIARSCWVKKGQNRWYFSYDYEARMINIRHNNSRGELIDQFDNNTLLEAIRSRVKLL